MRDLLAAAEHNALLYENDYIILLHNITNDHVSFSSILNLQIQNKKAVCAREGYQPAI